MRDGDGGKRQFIPNKLLSIPSSLMRYSWHVNITGDVESLMEKRIYVYIYF